MTDLKDGWVNHSVYKGWQLQRLFVFGQAKMRYRAVKGDRILESRNLDGIKDKVTKEGSA